MRFIRILRPLSVAAVAALVASTLFMGNASAQDVSGQQAKVDQLTAALDKLQSQSSVLDEQYLQTNQQLDAVRTQIDQNKADVADAQSRMDQAKAQASSYVVSAYMGVGSGMELAPGTGDPNTAVNQKFLLETLQGNRQQVADDLRAAKLDLADKSAVLEASTSQLKSQQDKQKSIKSDLEASVAKQQDLLSGANADLQAAVQAQQAKEAAEAAAKAQAAEQAREAAAAQAAAADATTTATTSSKGATTTAAKVAASKATTATRSAARRAPAAPAAPAAPVSAPNGGAGAAIAAARSVLGVPYHWAGASPSGFDCSGLTMWAYAHAGVGLPHSSGGQYAGTQRVPVSALQPGDLVFYGSPVHHVGLYIGGGQMIHAPHSGDVVRVASIYGMGETPMGGRIR